MEFFENLDDTEHENNERDDDNEHSDSDQSNDDYEYLHTRVALCVHHFLKYSLKVPCRTSSHTRYKFVMEVLKGHKDRCHQQFRMEKHVFMKLCNTLSQKYGLQKGRDVSLVETLAMFLITLGHVFGNRMVQERFQHSSETISRWFELMLDVVCEMAIDIVRPSNPHFNRIPKKFRDND